MSYKVIRLVGLWIVFAVVLICVGYSSLVLRATSAYADTVCEPEDCAVIEEAAPELCINHKGVRSVDCPVRNFPDTWLVTCNDGVTPNGSCSNF